MSKKSLGCRLGCSLGRGDEGEVECRWEMKRWKRRGGVEMGDEGMGEEKWIGDGR